MDGEGMERERIEKIIEEAFAVSTEKIAQQYYELLEKTDFNVMRYVIASKLDWEIAVVTALKDDVLSRLCKDFGSD